MSMVILLPAAKDGLAALETTFKGTNLLAWMGTLGRMMESEADIQLPRFNLTSQFALAQTLGAMGMPSAFDKNADSGMDGTRNLFISALVHQAMVEVNEEGTIAVAATAGGVGLTSVLPPIPTFRMDHPFIFVIRERDAGAVLFVGRVTNPKG
jgi:serpin B